MRLTADTNVLIRAIVGDDERQGELAKRELAAAEEIAIPLSALCELVWVLRKNYGYARNEVADMLEILMTSQNVSTDRHAASAGLAHLRSGGDFADGVIAFEGRMTGAEVFLTFDRQAARLVQDNGGKVRMLR